MYDPLRAKAKVALWTGGAFIVGIGVAAGLGWTQVAPMGPVVDEKPLVAPELVKPAADLSASFTNLAKVVTPAVVRIQSRVPASARPAEEDVPFRFFDRQPQEPDENPEPGYSGGSGFLISADGYILTNDHVVADADQITVYLNDRRYFDAKVVGSDPFTDVAVIKIDVPGALPFLPFGNSEDVQVGQWVLAVGNPGSGNQQLDYTVTQGIVSARGRGLDILRRELFRQYGNDPATQSFANYAIEDFIQTDAVINPGNSGGPMVNLLGQVVGINSAIATNTGYYQGYGFAIPINLARHVMEDLVAYGQVKRPLIGVVMQTVTPEDAEYYGLPSVSGALVQAVSPRGPAEGAGVRAGDVITAVDGKGVGYSGQLQQRIAEHHPGDRVTLTLYREKKIVQIPVQLGDAPINATATKRAEAVRPPDERLGIKVKALDAATASEMGFSKAGGVILSEVTPGSAAYEHNLGSGEDVRPLKVVQIDRKAVSTPDDVRRALDAVPPGKVVSLLLEEPTGDRQIVNLRMPAR